MAMTHGSASGWSDGKRYLWLLGALTITLPILAAQLALSTGLHVFWWFGPLFAFGVIPILDTLIGDDRDNPPEDVVPRLERERYYRLIVYLATLVEYVAFFACVWIVGTHALAWYDYVGFALSLGAATGISINTAHELGHKTNRFERWLAKITLAPVAYGHFYVEHNRGHHVRVATAEDPASARYGESFWAFLPRTVTGSIRSAWRLEKARLERLGHSPWDPAQRSAARVGDDRRRVGHRDRDGRQGRDSVPRDPGRLRRVAARSRELRRALQPAAASCRTAATNAARRSIRGTAITSSPTCSCTSCSGTPTITRIRRARTRRCATSTMRRNCRPATRR